MITSPYLEQFYSHHQFQGLSNNCGPFCAAAAMNILKQKQIMGADLGRTMERIEWKNKLPVIRRIRNWATFPWGIQDILQEEKIPARWMLFQNTKKLLQMLPQENILIVLIGNYFPAWAHYKILGAFDPKCGFGFIDSAFRDGELHWDTAMYFKKYWGHYGNQVICVFPSETSTC